MFTVTAPYSRACRRSGATASVPMPWYNSDHAYGFLNTHGLAVRAVGESPMPCPTLPGNESNLRWLMVARLEHPTKQQKNRALVSQ